MGAFGLAIIMLSLLASIGICVGSRGHLVLIALPLTIGFPLADLLARRR